MFFLCILAIQLLVVMIININKNKLFNRWLKLDFFETIICNVTLKTKNNNNNKNK